MLTLTYGLQLIVGKCLEEQNKSWSLFTAIIADPGNGLAHMQEKVLILAEQ